ncbi:MAG: polysaccharide deacetylase family protein [Pseudorhodobacter sp.]|nr:polysaccharide deacetylase family protein [Pseudorhodobacter sp.]
MTQRQIGIIFHGIGEPSRTLEPGEAPYWITVAAFDALLDRIRAHPEPDRFRLSFDDGNLSDHDIALPRLLARGLRADFFVLSGRIGQAGSLDAARFLALQAAGMTIGSHGIAHRKWHTLDAPTLAAELTQSRAVLQVLCGQPIDTAGIPFGAYDAKVLAALGQAGYRAAYSSDRGWVDPQAFLRPRTSVTGAMDEAAVKALLAGHLPPLARLRRGIAMAHKRLI